MVNFKRMLFIAILVSIGAQFHLNLFIEGFIITLSIVILPLLLYKYKNLNPITTCFVTGVVSPLIRTFLLSLEVGDFLKALNIVSPDIAFYISYGIIYFFMYTSSSNKNLTKFVVTIFISDFLSNIIEISVRTRIIGIDISIVKGLLLIAVLRTLVVLIIFIAFKRYESFLKKEEHEKRYRRLLLLSSSFKSEIYFIRKNMHNIEEIMKKVFNAYRITEKYNAPKEIKEMILELSKDIHEIKKDYLRVIKGLEQINENKLEINNISLKDLIEILIVNTREYICEQDLEIELNSEIDTDIKIEKHYYLMSILRNLINNSIEAIKHKGKIKLNVYEKEDKVFFIISDDGIGIKEKHLEYIFNPGFSTKYNQKTGDISRGIGLVLVKELLEDYFEGDIKVKSKEGEGTTFIISIKKDNLRGNNIEVLHS